VGRLAAARRACDDDVGLSACHLHSPELEILMNLLDTAQTPCNICIANNKLVAKTRYTRR
jgi:hypothetical protein